MRSILRLFRLMFAFALVVGLWLSTTAAAGSGTGLIQAVTVILAVFSPLVFKGVIPKDIKGIPMALIAMGAAAGLALIDMAVSGELNHLDLLKLAFYITSFVGSQQGFYALFKDAWKLNT